MSDGFYRAFEERHRGPRELIKERVSIYLPFVAPLLAAYPSAPALDLGCGRGEWLELLVESGFEPVGVDLDKGMLEACLERGLLVEQGDALVLLSALPDESQAVVSAFHVVEHITFDQLRTLVAEALRVLKPGGLLIMETPNPENIVVATRNFYLDPTHQRPIPSALLAFVAEYAGFARVKTLRLQESKELVNKDDVSLQDVFAGASPDYAVVAQKAAADDVLALTSDAFNADYGLSLENILGRWDTRFDRVETRAEQAEAKAVQANTISQKLLSSVTWRVTAPLRRVGSQLELLRQHATKLRLKSIVRQCIASLMSGLKTLIRPLYLRSAVVRTVISKLLKITLLRRLVLAANVPCGKFYAELQESSPVRELLVDVSNVYSNDLKTGIQRVVRSILSEFMVLIEGISVEPVYLTDIGGFWHYRYVNSPESAMVVPKKDDVFLGLDLNSNVVGAEAGGLFCDWKLREVKVVFVVYDILPLEHPEWWSPGVGTGHELWLRAVLRLSDDILCISQTVQGSVRDWALRACYKEADIPRINYFHLGADIDASIPSKGLPDDAELTLGILKQSQSFLMVGTIEPRKGYVQVLDAFECLWAQGQEITLVIVGKQGWLVDKLVARIRVHPEIGKRLFWLENISDEYLSQVYSVCKCLLAASEGEGYGLPLIEAAQNKLPIIARDIEVFREVLGEYAFYFCGGTAELVEAVTVWIALFRRGENPSSGGVKWLTWKESVSQFISRLNYI